MRPAKFMNRRGHERRDGTVIHLPHASCRIPASERDRLLPSDDQLHSELLRITDLYTDELFDFGEAIDRVVFPVSRLVVDPDRPRDDSTESMAARGMGAVYTNTSDGQALREEIGPAERDRLLSKYYDPHHKALTDTVGKALRKSDRCLILDCHSFPSRPLACDLDQNADRPDICLGKDWFHTPNDLLSIAVNILQARGWRVAVNTPYAGAPVPSAYYKYDWRVSSMKIEVNRSLYINERTGARLPIYEDFRRRVQHSLREIIAAAKKD